MVPISFASGAATVTNTTTTARLVIPRCCNSKGPEKIPAPCTMPDVLTVMSVVVHITASRISAATVSARLCSSG